MIKAREQRAKEKTSKSFRHRHVTKIGTTSRRRVFLALHKNQRKSGKSQEVLDVVDMMIQEYQSDLDYLKDK